MAFKVQYLLLADNVQDIGSGKLNILGTFNQITVPEVPTRYPGFTVAALLLAQDEDALGQHRLECRLVRPTGQPAIGVGSDFALTPSRQPGPLALARVVIGLQNVALREYGAHRVVLEVDGTPVAEHVLYVIRPPADAEARDAQPQ